MNFVEAMTAAQAGFDTWAAKPHNAKWAKMVYHTPIPNDLLVNIAEAFCLASPAPVAGVGVSVKATCEPAVAHPASHVTYREAASIIPATKGGEDEEADGDPCAIPLSIEQAEAIGFTSGMVAGGDTFGDEDDENPSHAQWDARAPQIVLDALAALSAQDTDGVAKP